MAFKQLSNSTKKPKRVFEFKRKPKELKEKTGQKKLPSFKQWKQLFHIFNKTEKIIFSFLIVVSIGAAITIGTTFYFRNTTIMPDFGGEYKEGMVGQPMSVNPLRLSSQDIDRDLVEILFSGLLKYDGNGVLINDLAESHDVLEDGKMIKVYLKKDIFWHDGKPLTIDDVMFTLSLIQDPQYQSPWRIKFLGVAVDEISGGGVKFTLPKKYAGFLENITFKILPKHIFKDIDPQSWPRLISKEYLIGSGPFAFKEMNEKAGYIKWMSFKRNENYYAKKPYIETVTFFFYKTSNDLLRAAMLGEIHGFAPTNIKSFVTSFRSNMTTYLIAIPRYFAIFFNTTKKDIFSDSNIKKALILATDKEKIISDVFGGKGQIAVSPILPEFFNLTPATGTPQYNKIEAEQILENAGFVLNEDTGIREKINILESSFSFTQNLTLKNQSNDVTELQKCLAKDKSVYPEGVVSGYFGVKTKVAVIKFQEKYKDEILVPAGLDRGNGEVKPLTRKKLNEVCFQTETETIPLEITITTSNKFPLMEIAENIKKLWEDVGISVTINKVTLSDLQTDVLANRNFQTLLFGEALSSIPDPFPFWHSSQKDHPGINIASYDSKKADALLETARQAQTEEERIDSLEKFQDVFLEDAPAIFLARPDYVHVLSPSIKGYNIKKITEPAKRFSTINEWYIETKRILQ